MYTSSLYNVFKNIASTIGWFDLKAFVKRELQYHRWNKEDNRKRREIASAIELLPMDALSRKNDASDVIVSLTSFGKRVDSFVPYTLYTLFQQTRLPNRIVLYLDKHWNDENIPKLLKRLKKSGLEIYYVDDIRSYKKLIPALKMFPHNIIITVDDDVYYDVHLVEKLLEAYKADGRKSIVCNNGVAVGKKDGRFLPYSQWKHDVEGNPEYSGVGEMGILYPGDCFDDEILKEEIFMKYLPTADDIWFWLQAYRCKRSVILNRGYKEKYPIRAISRTDIYREKGSTSLYFQNVIHKKNDEQFAAILAYYGM